MGAEFVDELTPVAMYMCREMNSNPKSQIGQRITALNAATSEKCIADYMRQPWWRQLVGIGPEECVRMGMSNKVAAMLLWGKQVKTNGPWDHKPHLFRKRALWSTALGRHDFHIYGETAYSFDVWSNVHYGYVGRALGFTQAVLLDGAGAAQFKSDIMNGIPLTTSGAHRGFRRWDRPEDRVSIRLGADLYRRCPGLMTPPVLVRAIVNSHGILKRPSQTLLRRARP